MSAQRKSILGAIGSMAIDLFKNHWTSLIGLAVLIFGAWLSYLALFELVPAIAQFIVDLGAAVKAGSKDLADSIPTPDGRIRSLRDLWIMILWLGGALLGLKVFISLKKRR